MTALGPCLNPIKESNAHMMIPSESSWSLSLDSSAMPFNEPEPRKTARLKSFSAISLSAPSYFSIAAAVRSERISM